MLSLLHPIDLLARERREPHQVDDLNGDQPTMSERSSSSKKLVKNLSGDSDRGDKEASSSRRASSLDVDFEDLNAAERTESVSSSHSNTLKDGSKLKKRSAKKEKSDGSDKKRREKAPSRLVVPAVSESISNFTASADLSSFSADDGEKKRKRKSADENRKRRTKSSRKHSDGKDSDGSSASDGHPESDDLAPSSVPAAEVVSQSSSSSTSLHLDMAFVTDVAGGPTEKRSPTTPKKHPRPMPLNNPTTETDASREDARPPPRVMPLVPPAPSTEDSLDSSMMTSVPPDDDSDEEPMSSWFSSYDERFPNRLSSDSLSRRRGRSNRHHRAVAPADDPRHSVAGDFPPSPAHRRAPSRERTSSSDDLSKKQDERVRINVGGRTFETFTGTLRKYPNTLLGTMFHPRNAKLLNLNKQPGAQEDIFFDRNPRVFEVILDFYRTGTVNRPTDVTLEMLKEELSFFQIELPEVGITNKRVSMELMKLEYMNIMLPATEYRKMARMKILSDHLATIVKILDFMQMKIEKKARSGHNSCALTFYSPLHYTNSTPPSIFKVVSTDEIREILIELLEAKGFEVKETNEYSKTKATSIIGLHDQVINYNDPKFFTFSVRW